MTPEINLQIQYCVVRLHGQQTTHELKRLLSDPSDPVISEEPVARAISYNAYYGEPEAKQLALELASKVKIGSS